MAGFSTLEAVNQILVGSGLPPTSALDVLGAAGSSVQGQAQYHLNFANATVLARGHRCNTDECKKYTLGSTGQITLASDVLRIQPAGPNARRNWVQRGSIVWDAERSTDQFPAGDYFFDITTSLTFDNVEAPVQAIIIAEAAKTFQQQMINNSQRDAYISERLAKAEVSSTRIPGFTKGGMPLNQPLVPSQPQ